MEKRLKLDETEKLDWTERNNGYGIILQEIIKVMDGLPLALIQASGVLSDDLGIIRRKEGKLTNTSINHVLEGYLQKYHEDFFDSKETQRPGPDSIGVGDGRRPGP